MSFATPLFLWFFLPSVLVTHWVLPNRFRNAVLAVGSLAFYTVGGKEFVLLLLALMAGNYLAGLGIDRFRDRPGTARAILAAAVLGDLGALSIWKYAGFVTRIGDRLSESLGGHSPVVDLALPIGISFFTFHHLSYVVDVYRGVRRPLRNPVTFATYIAMFPQLIAGPIVRYHEIADQLLAENHTKFANFAEGFPRFVWGLFKKVVIADALSPVADLAFAQGHPSFATAWVGAIAYTGQIYFDFSGYSDMAIGLGTMFGLRLPENFRRPYSAVSITDFWRRWHMSLSRWFRDYLYIPLGGNRGGRARTYRNLVIVFLLTGLWHGAAWTFVLWGIYHGFWLILERVTGLADAERLVPLRRAATLVIVIFGWVLFRADNLPNAWRMISAMVVPDRLRETSFGLTPDVALLMNTHHAALLALVVLVALLPGTFVVGRIIDGLDGVPVRSRTIATGLALLITPYVAVAAAAGTFSPFLYFQF